MGTNLRPDAAPALHSQEIYPRERVLRELYKSVARRRTLIRGKLQDGDKFCAFGCLCDDSQKADRSFGIMNDLVDEIAAVNDKRGPRASPHNRWKFVMRWLRKELAKLDSTSGRGEKHGT